MCHGNIHCPGFRFAVQSIAASLFLFSVLFNSVENEIYIVWITISLMILQAFPIGTYMEFESSNLCITEPTVTLVSISKHPKMRKKRITFHQVNFEKL